MKFSSQKTAPAPAVAEAFTLEDLQHDIQLERKFNKEMAQFEAATAIEKSFETIASRRESFGKIAVESLTPELRQDLADALGCSVESLSTMEDQEFVGKCLDLAKSGAEASNEVLDIGVVVLAVYICAIIMAFAGVKAYCDKYDEYYDVVRSLDKAFGNKVNEALDEVVVNSFSAKQFASQIKACQDCIKLLKKPVSEIFDPKFKLAEIERVAGKLWVAPDSWTIDENLSWWNGWRSNMPDREKKSLREHGFDAKTLVQTCHDLGTLVKEVESAWSARKERDRELAKAIEDKRGFFTRIRDWFNDKRTKEEKEAEAQQKVILRAKYEAIQNLSQGTGACINEMAWAMHEACMKCKTLVAKAPGKDEGK